MKYIAFVLLWLSLGSGVQAEEVLYDVYSLGGEASLEVANDQMMATLSVQLEDQDPARLAEKVNETMNWALTQLEAFDTLAVTTRNYQTYPRYDSSQVRRLIGWRATQSLQIESSDFAAAVAAIQTLQARLQVRGIQHAVQESTRRSAIDSLIEKALDAFKFRADLVRKAMGANDYHVLDVSIQTNEGRSPLLETRTEMTTRALSAVATEPALEAGTSRVSVQVFGRIQLN